MTQQETLTTALMRQVNESITDLKGPKSSTKSIVEESGVISGNNNNNNAVL